uniref:Uncharacterized protein n=1 Tax=Anguilla anguilla TaxID=7936 RepID=A0A0E9X9Q5_ANGAN
MITYYSDTSECNLMFEKLSHL